MSSEARIEKDDCVWQSAHEAGLIKARSHEPPAQFLQERFQYDPERGQIVGPSGKVLKLQLSHHGFEDGARIGVYYEKRQRTMIAARVAFAVQHGRYPVSLQYRDGDVFNIKAQNLREISEVDRRHHRAALRAKLKPVRDRLREHQRRQALWRLSR